MAKTNKRLAQKDAWLQKAGSSLDDLLGDKVEQLNKEGQKMNLLQKENESTEVDDTAVTEVNKEVETPVTEGIEVVKTEVAKVQEFLTKEEVATALTELLAPITANLDVLTKAADKVAKLESQIEAMTAELTDLKAQLKEEKAMNKETVNESVPVASLASLVKERLLKDINGSINAFSNLGTITKEDKLISAKPAVKVETSEQPKHQLDGLVEGF